MAGAAAALAAGLDLPDRRGRFADIGGRDRQQGLHGRDLPRRRDELGVRHVQAVDRPLDVELDVFVRQDLDLVELGTVLELGVGRVRDDLAEAEKADSPLARDLERRLDSLGLVVLMPEDRRSQDVAVVAAGQPTIARDHQQAATRLIGSCVVKSGCLTSPEVSPRSATSSAILRVIGLGLGRPVERLAKPVGGDQLHRPGDLADVLDRLAALDDRAGLGHGVLPVASCRVRVAQMWASHDCFI